jgi:hypothetical protein
VRDARVDEGADAVPDGEPVEENHAAAFAERERARRAACVKLDGPRRLEPGRSSLGVALTVSCDGLSRDQEQQCGERAGIDTGMAEPHGTNTREPATRVPRAAARPMGGETFSSLRRRLSLADSAYSVVRVAAGPGVEVEVALGVGGDSSCVEAGDTGEPVRGRPERSS